MRVARNLYVRRGKDSHFWLEYAIVCKISGGVLWGSTAGTAHGLTDDIPWAIHVLVPAGRRIKPSTAGGIIRSRVTRQTRNLEISVEQMCADGFHLRVTDKARTVIDPDRWGSVRQHAVEASCIRPEPLLSFTLASTPRVSWARPRCEGFPKGP